MGQNCRTRGCKSVIQATSICIKGLPVEKFLVDVKDKKYLQEINSPLLSNVT